MPIMTPLNVENCSRMLTTRSGLAVVYFSASWCQPCKDMKPVFLQLAEAHPGDEVSFGTVDVAESPTLAQTYGVRAVPAIVVFRQGRLAAVISGQVPLEVVTQRVRHALFA